MFVIPKESRREFFHSHIMRRSFQDDKVSVEFL